MTTPKSSDQAAIKYKRRLRVWMDFGSTGIWEIQEPKQVPAGGLVCYEALKLPDWLVARFEFWTSWYWNYEPWRQPNEFDHTLFNAYKMALAIDLKRVLGANYYVECNDQEVLANWDLVRMSAGS